MDWQLFIINFIFFAVGCVLTFVTIKVHQRNNAQGILKIVYDKDNPEYPVMGLEIESLKYVLSNNYICLEIKKLGFPDKK